jgi:hypothetical protein
MENQVLNRKTLLFALALAVLVAIVVVYVFYLMPSIVLSPGAVP